MRPVGRNARRRVCIVCLSIVAGACGAAPPPAPRTVVITTGTEGGNFHPVGVALAKAYSDANPDLRVEARVTEGAVNNLELLERGHAELALSFANVAYDAYVGHLPSRAPAFSQLRAIALLPLSSIQIIVGPHSTARSLADLQGRRVRFGGRGSGGAYTAQLVFRAYGVDPEHVIQQYDGRANSPDDLASGNLDAVVVQARYPVGLVASALERGGRLLPLAGEPAERLHREYPFFRPTVIPAGTYPGQPAAVQTIGINAMLLCRADLDDALVFRLTKTLIDTLSRSPDTLLMGSIAAERVAAPPIPLHPGAVRYYRQRELFP